MSPRRGKYSSRIHVDDARIIQNCTAKVAALIAIDEFTEENGATWVPEGSHELASGPSEDEFFRKAKRLVCPAGTIRCSPRTLQNMGIHAQVPASCDEYYAPPERRAFRQRAN